MRPASPSHGNPSGLGAALKRGSVFVRSLHPDERLEVDHVARAQVALVAPNLRGKGKQAGMPLGEMELLLAAGLTPMEVIEAGTRQSAIVCSHGDELGTLAPGMLADLIVVDGDPLQDMQAMSRVVLVIKNGEIAVISEGNEKDHE